MDQLGQFILPGERVIVPGYYVGQAALLGGTGVHALLLEGSCMWPSGQSILPGKQAVVPGYHVGQAVLPGGTGGQA